uniref:Uncharacterized protein n=1 Tax=Timema poppense TaxID=170557 RepID=A0A7R9DWQ3_TIMPO|nr:unnamed protein product [Timema poppensis]
MVRRHVVRVKHKFFPRRDPSWCFLDRISLVVFPFVFALFNAIYWSSVHVRRNSIGQTISCP